MPAFYWSDPQECNGKYCRFTVMHKLGAPPRAFGAKCWRQRHRPPHNAVGLAVSGQDVCV
eukprot:scaffold140398_cov169-Phaeocystis_antarctica.AAC.1